MKRLKDKDVVWEDWVYPTLLMFIGVMAALFSGPWAFVDCVGAVVFTRAVNKWVR